MALKPRPPMRTTAPESAAAGLAESTAVPPLGRRGDSQGATTRLAFAAATSRRVTCAARQLAPSPPCCHWLPTAERRAPALPILKLPPAAPLPLWLNALRPAMG